VRRRVHGSADTPLHVAVLGHRPRSQLVADFSATSPSRAPVPPASKIAMVDGRGNVFDVEPVEQMPPQEFLQHALGGDLLGPPVVQAQNIPNGARPLQLLFGQPLAPTGYCSSANSLNVLPP
jgi:hypothetical protein